MDVKLARAILIEAKKGEYYHEEIPEDEGELFNDALYFIEEAKLAYETDWGKKDDAIVAIMGLAGTANSGDLIPKLVENGSNVSAQLYEGLPIPEDVEKPHPIMPRDITQLSDTKIRKLYGEFNALQNRAKWCLAVATNDLADAIHLRDDAYRKSYSSLDKKDEETGKVKTTAQLENEAKEDNKYKSYNDDAAIHSMKVTNFKVLSEIYSSNITVLSREMTFRQLEWEKSK